MKWCWYQEMERQVKRVREGKATERNARSTLRVKIIKNDPGIVNHAQNVFDGRIFEFHEELWSRLGEPVGV